MVEFCSRTPLMKLSKNPGILQTSVKHVTWEFREQMEAQNEADGDVVTDVQESDDDVLAMNAAGEL
jgi:hypothetical protein